MQRLYEVGFQKSGTWSLKGEELVLQLSNLADRQNVLYAFVSGSTVKYVGKTTQSLQRRMFGYQRPNVDQRTNWRNRIAIIDLLKNGHEVDILALADTGLLRYGSFHLNLAAGLEDSIIVTLKPEWNGSRTSEVIETPTETNPPDTSIEAKLEEKIQEAGQYLPKAEPTLAPPHVTIEIHTPTTAPQQAAGSKNEPRVHRLAHVAANQPRANVPNHDAKFLDAAPHFRLTLQETYYRTGFFNVPINVEKYFGKDTESITIYCGREKLAVIGKINRTANNNGTPRIMGQVPLREWFQKRRAMSQLKVSIIDPTTIHINDA
jgi:hypothetical protein